MILNRYQKNVVSATMFFKSDQLIAVYIRILKLKYMGKYPGWRNGLK